MGSLGASVNVSIHAHNRDLFKRWGRAAGRVCAYMWESNQTVSQAVMQASMASLMQARMA